MEHETIVAVAPNGELCLLTPLYPRMKSDNVVDTICSFTISVHNSKETPYAYLLEYSTGRYIFNSDIINKTFVLGDL